MDSISPVKSRLFELCVKLGITPDYLSKKIGKNREYIRKIKQDIGSETLRQIYLNYPEVNVLWLITGEGEMLLSDNKQTVNYSENKYLLDRLEQKSEEVGQLKEEIKKLKALLGVQEENNSKTG